MTGCHYKKCLRAPQLLSLPRCHPLLAFREAARPAGPHCPGTGALPQAQAQPGGLSLHTTRLAFMLQGLSPQNRRQNKTKQNIWIHILSTNTQNKHNCNTERRSQLFFPLNMKRVLEPPVMLSMASCLHCHPTPPVP